MATAKKESPDNCSICMEQFKDPRQLTCFHTFCLDCLQTFVSKSSEDGKFACPLCRYEVTLPENGVTGFPQDIYVEARVKKQAHCVGQSCGVCDQRATHMCDECEILLCEFCTKHHKVLPISRSHLLIYLDDPTEERRLLSRERFCEKHKKETLRFFCEKCDTVICRDCKLTSHDCHKTVDIADVVDDARNQLAEMKEELEKCMQTMETSFDVIRKHNMMVTVLLDKGKVKINKFADQMIDMINEARNKAMDKVRLMEETKEIKFQDANCARRQKQLFLQSQLDHISNIVKDGLDCDVTAAPSEMKQLRELHENDASVCVDMFHQSLDLSSLSVKVKDQLSSMSSISDAITHCLSTALWEPMNVTTLKSAGKFSGKIRSISFTQSFKAWIVYDTTEWGFESKISLYRKTESKPKYTMPVDYVHLKQDSVIQLLQRFNAKNPDKIIPLKECNTIKKPYPQQDVNNNGDWCWVDEQKRVASIQLSSGVLKHVTFNPFSNEHQPFIPCDICWGDNGELYIVDSGSKLIVVYSLTEGFLQALFIPEKSFDPSAVAMDNKCNLWIGEASGAVSIYKVK